METLKKNWIWAVIALIAMTLFAIWLLERQQNDVRPQAEPSKAEAEILLNNCETEKIVGLSISGEEMIRLYEVVARLEAELNACRQKEVYQKKTDLLPADETTTITSGRSAAVSTTSTRTAPSEPTTITPKREEVISTPATRESSLSAPEVVTSQYVGEIAGDFGVTFDDKAKLFFYLKASLLDRISNRNTSDSRLNSPSGPKGQLVGEYFIYKTDQTVTNEMLNEWKWAIYIGNHTQYGYDMWVPHELVKLNASLANNNVDVEANSIGGYHFNSKVNYKRK